MLFNKITIQIINDKTKNSIVIDIIIGDKFLKKLSILCFFCSFFTICNKLLGWTSESNSSISSVNKKHWFIDIPVGSGMHLPWFCLNLNWIMSVLSLLYWNKLVDSPT